jgi:hypothetical protein
MPSMKSAINLCLTVLFCATAWPGVGHCATMDDIAEEWVKLALALGQHDDGYVDAYQGPVEWQEAAESQQMSLQQISQAATATQQRLAIIDVDDSGFLGIELLRHRSLTKSLSSLQARIEMLQGRSFTFDEESMALYDAVAPHNTPQHFQKILDQLDVLLPGDGSLGERRNAFRELFIIPKDKLDAVFQAAIVECRKRTLRRIPLPEGEGFTVEYVTDKPWSGYNWFQGDSQSLIQVNTDLPIYIDRAIDLACHEGYPGHHVYNLLLEQNLYRKRGWVEFSIYVLYGPQALIAEGSANYGIDMTFSRKERLAFEKAHLFPLAGLDPTLAERYYKVEELVEKLNFANNEAARAYVDGVMSKTETIAYLKKYGLLTQQRAEQRIRFIDAYSSYVISYNLGQELVGNWIESVDDKTASEDERWERFIKLLSAPYIPSGLVESGLEASGLE